MGSRYAEPVCKKEEIKVKCRWVKEIINNKCFMFRASFEHVNKQRLVCGDCVFLSTKIYSFVGIKSISIEKFNEILTEYWTLYVNDKLTCESNDFILQSIFIQNRMLSAASFFEMKNMKQIDKGMNTRNELNGTMIEGTEHTDKAPYGMFVEPVQMYHASITSWMSLSLGIFRW